jgi:RNase P subunit RPR2
MENILGNTLGTWGNIGNLMRTHWELKRNIVGTNQDPGENEKNPFPPKLKRKKCKAC